MDDFASMLRVGPAIQLPEGTFSRAVDAAFDNVFAGAWDTKAGGGMSESSHIIDMPDETPTLDENARPVWGNRIPGHFRVVSESIKPRWFEFWRRREYDVLIIWKQSCHFDENGAGAGSGSLVYRRAVKMRILDRGGDIEKLCQTLEVALNAKHAI